jgi:hypothetical protein
MESSSGQSSTHIVAVPDRAGLRRMQLIEATYDLSVQPFHCPQVGIVVELTGPPRFLGGGETRLAEKAYPPHHARELHDRR